MKSNCCVTVLVCSLFLLFILWNLTCNFNCPVCSPAFFPTLCSVIFPTHCFLLKKWELGGGNEKPTNPMSENRHTFCNVQKDGFCPTLYSACLFRAVTISSIQHSTQAGVCIPVWTIWIIILQILQKLFTFSFVEPQMGVVKNKLTLFHEVLKNFMSLLLLSGKLSTLSFWIW